MTKLEKVPAYNGKYLVSDEGKVFISNFQGSGENREVSQFLTARYPSVTLSHPDDNRTHRTEYVHRLVAGAFIRELEESEVVNHMDGNRQNNALSNLEIVSHKENIQHAIDALGLEVGIRKTAVVAEDVDTGELHVYPSIATAVRAGFHQTSISKCCLGNRSTHKGFKWHYADPGSRRTNRRQEKTYAVNRVSRGSGEVKRYESVNSVQKDGYNPSSVSKCCRGIQDIHRGYRWEFADEGVGKQRKASNTRSVQSFNRATGEVKKYASIAEAVTAGFEPTGVIRACKGEQLSHRGLEWRYLT